MSSAQLRKIKKPLIEKKRRERMNHCLNELKTLVLEGKNTNSNESRYSKMEKVDILEMTVRYLKEMKQLQSPCAGSLHSFAAKYIEGYRECATQVGQYLSSAKELSDDTRQQLTQHLANSMKNSPTVGSSVTPGSGVQAYDTSGRREAHVIAPSGTESAISPMITSGYQCSTIFAIIPSVATSGGELFNRTEAQGSNPARDIPVLIPSSVFLSPNLPGQLHPPGSAVLVSRPVSVPSPSRVSTATANTTAVPPALLAAPLVNSGMHPTVVMVTGDQLTCVPAHGLFCGSPKQGDECPTSFSTSSSTRSPSTGSTPPSCSNLQTPVQRLSSEASTPGTQSHCLGDNGVQHQTPTAVWRPWGGNVDGNTR